MKILVVEDKKKHSQDALAVAEQLTGVEVDFATSLEEATSLVRSKKYDGVISDVFFPNESGQEPVSWQNALNLSNLLTKPELGFVNSPVHHIFVTDIDHHKKEISDFCWKTPVDIHGVGCNNYHFLTSGQLIDKVNEDGSKLWKVAFRYILLAYEFIKLSDKGSSIIDEGQFDGSPYGGGNLSYRLDDESNTTPMPEFALGIFAKYNV